MIDTDIEKADLNQFAPDAEDILINQPEALSLGCCVSIFGSKGLSRAARGGDPILERHYVQGPVTLEVEVFDWL